MSSETMKLTRDVTREECPWLDADIPAATTVYRYTQYTYGCISPSGIAVSLERDGPFMEVPRSAVEQMERERLEQAVDRLSRELDDLGEDVLEQAGYGKPVIRRGERAPLTFDNPVRRLELWQVPASELDDIELAQQFQYAADKFDNRGEHGGSPGEYWAERLDEIEAEQKRRALRESLPTAGGEKL